MPAAPTPLPPGNPAPPTASAQSSLLELPFRDFRPRLASRQPGAPRSTAVGLDALGPAAELRLGDSTAHFFVHRTRRGNNKPSPRGTPPCPAWVLAGRPPCRPNYCRGFRRTNALPSRRFRSLLAEDECAPPTTASSCSPVSRLHPARRLTRSVRSVGRSACLLNTDHFLAPDHGCAPHADWFRRYIAPVFPNRAPFWCKIDDGLARLGKNQRENGYGWDMCRSIF